MTMIAETLVIMLIIATIIKIVRAPQIKYSSIAKFMTLMLL